MLIENNDQDDDKKNFNVLLVNIKSIARIHPYDKLYIIDNKFIIKDERIFQSVQRWLNGDNRRDILQFIRYLIINCEHIIENAKVEYEDCLKMIRILPSFIVGLENLKLTYQEDTITVFLLENYVDQTIKLIENFK